MQLAKHTSQSLAPLRFITCGSVDDGKSTLIGRLLVDSKAVLQDQLAGVQRAGETDLALLTDGLSAEREQGITIDVAYRYFQTPQRKFIIGDTPGHEQYTRNMVTAASTADAAVLLVDALKLDWENPQLTLLPQTRRHALLVQLLRVPSMVFAVNKLDAVADPARAFDNICQALRSFAMQAGITIAALVPVSALKGWGIVQAGAPAGALWPDYQGPGLLELLEGLPATPVDTQLPLSFSVQWVEKQHDSGITEQGRRIFWGRVGTGKIGQGAHVRLFPSGQRARERGAECGAQSFNGRCGFQCWDYFGPRGRSFTRRQPAGRGVSRQRRDPNHADGGLDGRGTAGTWTHLLGFAWPPLGQGQSSPHHASSQYPYSGARARRKPGGQ